jgi:hypothetical protein
MPRLDARRAGLLLALGTVWGCSPSPFEDAPSEMESGTTLEADLCEATRGARFRSVERMECGQGPGGAVFGYWRLEFQPDLVRWKHSDVEETAPYRCDGQEVVAQFGGLEVRARLLDAGRTIEWQGALYERDP